MRLPTGDHDDNAMKAVKETFQSFAILSAKSYSDQPNDDSLKATSLSYYWLEDHTSAFETQVERTPCYSRPLGSCRLRIAQFYI